MHEVHETFMAHVTVNNRIYELTVTDIGSHEEKLYINGLYCKNFPRPFQEDWLKKRSIWIEDKMVHLLSIQGQWSVDVEGLGEWKTSLDEQSLIPNYQGPKSTIYESTEYLKHSEEDEARQFRSKVGKSILASIMALYGFAMFKVNHDTADLLFSLVIGGIIVTEYYYFMETKRRFRL